MKAIMHHVCILSRDYEESVRFYTDVLGGRIIKENKDFHGREYNSWIQLWDFKIELQTPKKEEMFAERGMVKPGVVHFAVLVEDAQQAYQEITAKGYGNFARKNGEAIYEVMGEKLFKVIAPEGTIIEFRDTDIS